MLFACELAGVDGSRTHRGPQRDPATGFEDRGTHQGPTTPRLGGLYRLIHAHAIALGEQGVSNEGYGNSRLARTSATASSR